MTLTPEERAENLTYAVLTVLCRSQVSESELEQCKSLITQAITQAQDEKLEEAAAFLIEAARPKAFGSISVADESNMQAAVWSAERVRSLKSKD